jgi:hypothetical protein
MLGNCTVFSGRYLGDMRDLTTALVTLALAAGSQAQMGGPLQKGVKVHIG